MSQFLHRSLTNDALSIRTGRRYEGRILRVEVELVFNKWKWTTDAAGKVMKKQEAVPIIMFEDGWDWIPNRGARRLLTETWGVETDGWIGRRLAIYLVVVVRPEKHSGRAAEKLEKRIECLADDADRRTE